jgi:hypothetical protein
MEDGEGWGVSQPATRDPLVCGSVCPISHNSVNSGTEITVAVLTNDSRLEWREKLERCIHEILVSSNHTPTKNEICRPVNLPHVAWDVRDQLYNFAARGLRRV